MTTPLLHIKLTQWPEGATFLFPSCREATMRLLASHTLAKWTSGLGGLLFGVWTFRVLYVVDSLPLPFGLSVAAGVAVALAMSAVGFTLTTGRRRKLRRADCWRRMLDAFWSVERDPLLARRERTPVTDVFRKEWMTKHCPDVSVTESSR